jgi:hypothetical protein
MTKELVSLIEALTGQEIPVSDNIKRIKQVISDQTHFRHSQFNELLLSLGFDRVSEEFFNWVFKDFIEKRTGEVSFSHLDRAVKAFQKNALYRFGNVKYAFKSLSSQSSATLSDTIEALRSRPPKEFKTRPKPIEKISPIEKTETYLLGYLYQDEVKKLYEQDKNDKKIKELRKKQKRLISVGKENHSRYLCYDWMDVYIATSMRQRHEYFVVAGFIEELFNESIIKELNLRYFDPTQAVCDNRIDKGLVEALMLKRSSCTIYHAQESDTLGKDSELAATLAQGKPVIAFVPDLKDEDDFLTYVDNIIDKCYKGDDPRKILLEQIQVYYPDGAWKDTQIQKWTADKKSFNPTMAKKILFNKAKEMYDKRAAVLTDHHPLGLQVHLETGVANGVLVVRSVKKCAKLLRAVILNQLKFDLINEPDGSIRLRERISQSTFRVRTGDNLLMNSFWNFYL